MPRKRKVPVLGGDHTYHTFTLQPGAYTKTLESLRESDSEVWDYVFLKLRHDLINDECIVIKMPSPIHEFMAGMAGDLIKNQSTAILTTISNEDSNRLVEGIISLDASAIHLGRLKTFRQPDQQFRDKKTYYPGVVIEIASSQSFKQLRRKASDLIVKSRGKVQLVIGLEIESKKSSEIKSSKISVWRPEFFRFENHDAVTMKTIINQDIIRDSDGTIRSGGLRFYLQDFSKDLAVKYPNADLTEEIVLSYDVLAEYLVDTEQWKKSSPEEELTPEDEEKVCDLEKRLDERSKALDPDYSEDSETEFENGS